MVFINNMRNEGGWWREHVKLLENLDKVMHHFFMPEAHQYLTPILLEFALTGNKYAQESACSCLAKIITHQHHVESRKELMEIIKKEMFESSKWTHRRTFIIFCKKIITMMPREFFKEFYIKSWIECSQDKIPNVRIEFASASVIIRPYFENEVNLKIELMEIINNLMNDPDQDVAEAAENAEYQVINKDNKPRDREQLN